MKAQEELGVLAIEQENESASLASQMKSDFFNVDKLRRMAGKQE
eukprot:CAMPEP_0174304642 /NCGR_PEP_ID=MMETSP0809-20121228/60910_1 /TAXON_ID=73025 ORGANISM="Eutreptiella gymnastica-like, Strain CCMP1594" /NCGR_SAMPLE_ID=MMETSP0809 /ASSEMBLY_ACC=CAM_ASM_000658 /LENGTH=43 /DNA_ID= /DNA_START= /DNA_END= /DNA_ORIENTATION=